MLKKWPLSEANPPRKAKPNSPKNFIRLRKETRQMSKNNSNSNWVEKPDGWHKTSQSTTKGNASYFERPAPPVRDAATGWPIVNGKPSAAAAIQESNKKHGS